MKLSLFGRFAMAILASMALGLGMTACGGGTIGYMWVLGQQYNQIAGFKVDDYTGNLTQIPGAPFPSNGAVPVSLVVKPGGRYLYVLNQGTGGSAAGKGTSSGIAVYAIGGDGTLTYQIGYNSQGFVPQWLQMDSTGTYLYVLDKYSPGPTVGTTVGPNTDGNGSITVFQSDPSTGRLTLVTNSQTLVNNVNTNFFEVGPQPFMMKTEGGCLLTANGGNQTISPFVINSGNGQLTFGTNQFITTGAKQLTSINGNSSYIFLTDAGNNNIQEYTVGTGCSLTSTTGASYGNLTGASDPVYSLVDASNAYLYVLNQFATSPNQTVVTSSISAYHISPTNGQLTPITLSAFTAGSGPVCMAEDPTNQYMYISNHNDGSVTGKLFDPTTGNLSQLTRGAVFPSAGLANCLVISGAID